MSLKTQEINKRSKEDIKKEMIDLLSSGKHKCKNLNEIKTALERNGFSVSNSKVQRTKDEIGAYKSKKTGYYVLSKKVTSQQKLKSLRGIFKKLDYYPDFFSSVEVAILKTRPHDNTLFAEHIRDTFEREVLSTSCPNNEDVIIFYIRKAKKTKTTKDNPPETTEPAEAQNLGQNTDKGHDEDSRMVTVLSRLCQMR